MSILTASAEAISELLGVISSPAPPPPALDEWIFLTRFAPPLAVTNRFTKFTPDAKLHRLAAARGLLNLDYYPLHATLPAGVQPQAVLREMRLRFNKLVDQRMANFEPYDDEENTLWSSPTPTGAVLHIDMRTGGPLANLDDGSVVVAEAADDHWIFSTVWTPLDLGHPVSGNRWFGYFENGDGTYTFGNRGADRPTGLIDHLADGTIFSSGHALWLSLQQGLARLIETMGGDADIKPATFGQYSWADFQQKYGTT